MKELIISACLIIAIGFAFYTIVNTINNVEIEEQLEGKPKMVMVMVEIFAWGLLMFSFVYYSKINKVWNSKWLSLKPMVGSLLLGVFGIFIPI